MASYDTARHTSIAGYTVRTFGALLLFIPGIIGTLVADAVALMVRRANAPDPYVSYTKELVTAFFRPLPRKAAIKEHEQATKNTSFSPNAVLLVSSVLTTAVAALILTLIMLFIPFPFIIGISTVAGIIGAGILLLGIGSAMESIGERRAPEREEIPAPTGADATVNVASNSQCHKRGTFIEPPATTYLPPFNATGASTRNAFNALTANSGKHI